jgi:glucosamine--fructose-6-phosphate aminotransferase (isomerizing)
MEPGVLIGQVEALACDLRTSLATVPGRIRDALDTRTLPALERVWLTGDGDSHFAGSAAECAFECMGGIDAHALSALRLLEYAPWSVRHQPSRSLLIAVSASGETPRVVDVLQRAAERGAPTLGITSTPDSAVTRIGTHSLVMPLSRRERSPGMCTFQASLLGLLLVAIHLGETQQRLRPVEAEALRTELLGIADALEATVDGLREPCREVTEAIADAPVVA